MKGLTHLWSPTVYDLDMIKDWKEPYDVEVLLDGDEKIIKKKNSCGTLSVDGKAILLLISGGWKFRVFGGKE